VARRKTLVQPKMSTADRREAIATAKMLQARGRTVGEIARALSVLPEIVEGWLRDLPAVN
jgi:transposase-like protein